MMVMVAKRDAQDSFGFLLLDDKPVEERFDVPRFKIKFELAARPARAVGFRCAGIIGFRKGIGAQMLDLLAEKIRPLPLDFFRGRRRVGRTRRHTHDRGNVRYLVLNHKPGCWS